VHARARVLTRKQLMSGDVVDALQKLWQAPAPAAPSADGAGEAACWLTGTFLPRRPDAGGDAPVP
jgi:hypothetical protein